MKFTDVGRIVAHCEKTKTTADQVLKLIDAQVAREQQKRADALKRTLQHQMERLPRGGWSRCKLCGATTRSYSDYSACPVLVDRMNAMKELPNGQ